MFPIYLWSMPTPCIQTPLKCLANFDAKLKGNVQILMSTKSEPHYQK